jgi:hypothetical protein
LQKAAGLDSEPPRSLPSAMGSIRLARAAAAPPLLPPADFDRSHGFRVTPNTSLNVYEPVPNSGVLVLPMMIAPAARSCDEPVSRCRLGARHQRTRPCRESGDVFQVLHCHR